MMGYATSIRVNWANNDDLHNAIFDPVLQDGQAQAHLVGYHFEQQPDFEPGVYYVVGCPSGFLF